jgi:hypothetical protein
MDRISRLGSYASFLLAAQFAATLLWIIVSWPPEGLAGLTDAMGDSFLAQAMAPFPFAFINLYNASFAATALVVVVIVSEKLPEFPYLTKFGVIAIVIAAALFLASGIIPIVSVPQLVKANDTSAVHAIVGVVTGLVLGATTAAGSGVILMASALLLSGRVPKLLCYICLFDGTMQLFEFAVHPFLILDPLFGTIWSLWVGAILWRDGLAVRRPAPALA